MCAFVCVCVWARFSLFVYLTDWLCGDDDDVEGEDLELPRGGFSCGLQVGRHATLVTSKFLTLLGFSVLLSPQCRLEITDTRSKNAEIIRHKICKNSTWNRVSARFCFDFGNPEKCASKKPENIWLQIRLVSTTSSTWSKNGALYLEQKVSVSNPCCGIAKQFLQCGLSDVGQLGITNVFRVDPTTVPASARLHTQVAKLMCCRGKEKEKRWLWLGLSEYFTFPHLYSGANVLNNVQCCRAIMYPCSYVSQCI